MLGGDTSEDSSEDMTGDAADRRLRVAVLGGGIAGLTAAHELVERGFDVSVFEESSELGGKSRSFKEGGRDGEHGFRFFPGFYHNVVDTMSRIDITTDPEHPTAEDQLVALRRARFSARWSVGGTLTRWGQVVIWASRGFGWACALVAVFWLGRLITDPSAGRGAVVLAAAVGWIVAHGAYLGLAGNTRDDDPFVEIGLPAHGQPGKGIAAIIREVLMRPVNVAIRWIMVIGLAIWAVLSMTNGTTWIVPVLVALALFLASPGMVLSVSYLWWVTRKIPRSVRPGVSESLFAFLATIKIVTAEPGRRHLNFENQSWWGYIQAWRFSPAYRLAYATGLTRTFVATRAEDMSARTGGMILAQLLYDVSPHFSRSHPADRVLRGPSQTAWINPWVVQLEKAGVRFNPSLAPDEIDGSPLRVVALLPPSAAQLAEAETGPRAATGTSHDQQPPIAGFTYRRVDSPPARHNGQTETGSTPTDLRISQGHFDYYVLAVSVTGAQAILANSPEVVALDQNPDLARPRPPVRAPWFRSTDELSSVGTPARLAGVFNLKLGWMNGIVYHLDERIEFPQGHLLCLESEWALTAIDQAPVWDGELDSGPDPRPKLGPRRGSILSVNVSDWFSPDRREGRPARYNHRSSVPATVWHQLTEHLPTLKNLESIPIVDRAIVEPTGDPRTGNNTAPNGDTAVPGEMGSLINREPMLINTERSWADRPAAATTFANLVLAGDYVRTETDFASMEAANEAARRAVRQILRTEGRLDEAPTVHRFRLPRSLEPIVRSIRVFDRFVRLFGLPHPIGLFSAPLGWAAGLENQARRVFARLGQSPKMVTLPEPSAPEPSTPESSTQEPTAQEPTAPGARTAGSRSDQRAQTSPASTPAP